MREGGRERKSLRRAAVVADAKPGAFSLQGCVCERQSAAVLTEIEGGARRRLALSELSCLNRSSAAIPPVFPFEHCGKRSCRGSSWGTAALVTLFLLICLLFFGLSDKRVNISHDRPPRLSLETLLLGLFIARPSGWGEGRGEVGRFWPQGWGRRESG
jgi:hypothetical protein